MLVSVLAAALVDVATFATTAETAEPLRRFLPFLEGACGGACAVGEGPRSSYGMPS